MAKEMKGITYCGECIYYSKKQHRCTAGAFVETDPRRTFYDDCPLPGVAAIVRCENCKHYNDYFIQCDCPNGLPYIKADSFCSFGERKDDDRSSSH